VRGLAFRLFDQTAKGRRTFTMRQLQAMPEAMQRAIRRIKVRTVKMPAMAPQIRWLT
jgi:hypothetical protein